MTSGIDMKDYLRTQAALVENRLTEAVPGDWALPPQLREAMMYSLLAGGKRLRPILVLAAAESLGGSQDAAMPIACAIEMVHTYSLIHDDLPAMDNDDFRRGKPTNHKVFGEAMAILAGDALLTHAFHAVAQAGLKHGVPAEQVLAITADLATYAGAKGMVGGQVADILGEQGLTSLEELEYIHRHKTADLIVFSLKAGGRAAGATEVQLRALEEFGYSIGLAFQIQDDILDVTGDEAKTGKPKGSDAKQQKVTYPYLIGLEESIRRVEHLTEAGKQAIRDAGLPHPDKLLAIADYLVHREF
ncbi:farnesyl-diphosphate synthase [Paenibacillus sp. J31TS4]|uniref:polyprenyl synthetase family protein n=1 Tax=Paenibacillus sp. J31TS4 TaxID=2807195 RepID=UPI001AFE788B|nr:farnesyl diphosphate synthase [Paenibacillus sp. J31TS4]GIP37600.1 farnesyl-diphosphate synthase [Paenibacillus sp. J31TS4]